MRKLVIGLVIAALAAFPVWSGGESESGEASAAAVQEIRVAGSFFTMASEGEMAELDPARRGTWGFHSLVWAPLVAGDTAGNYIPEKSLAPSYEVSTDGTVYTFNLREAKFSDGTPITAQNVVDCFGHWGMMLMPESIGYRDNYGMSKRLLPDVVGMLDFIDVNEYDEFGIGNPIPGVKAVDDRTVQITLQQPSVTFVRRLMVAFSVFKVDDLLAGTAANYDLLDYWPNMAAAAGPYMMTEAVAGEYYVLEPNPNYFGPKPQLKKITMLSVANDMNTIFTAYENDEIDVVATSITGDAARQAMGDPSLAEDLVQVPTWQVRQLWITPNVPLDDVHVRRAFSMAFDRKKMVEILNARADLPLFEVANMHRNPAVPDAVKETAAVTMLPFDPAAAKAELQKSKYWPEVLDMEIHLYAPNAEVVTVMEAYQKMLTDNLGLKKVTMELGSNSCAIVLDDADVADAAARIRGGGYAVTGQLCISVQRVIVHEAVYDDFVEKLVSQVEGIRVGNQLEPSTDMGPMISEDAAERVKGWIDEALAAGAKSLLPVKQTGALLTPTVLTGVSPDMKVWSEELFGPLVVVVKCRDMDHALELANTSKYGLQAGVFTANLNHALRAVREIDVGGVIVNDVPTFRVDPMPYGGVKLSGIGREGPKYAIEEMTEIRLVAFQL